MGKRTDNNGFSLVELIIVIAIMAVLVGLMAPQYLKYVDNSKVAADVANCEELCRAFNVAYANGVISAGTYTGAKKSTMTYAVGIDKWPDIKYKHGSDWNIVVNDVGIATVYIKNNGTDYEGWPNPKKPGGYYDEFHK